MTALKHLTEFIDICNHFRIVCESTICRLFTVTFKRRIRGWFEMLPAKSIHSWKHFMELFIDAHEDYNYQELRYEIGNLLVLSFQDLCQCNLDFMRKINFLQKK